MPINELRMDVQIDLILRIFIFTSQKYESEFNSVILVWF